MIKPFKLGVSVGIVWGLALFVCTIFAIYTRYAVDFLEVIKSVYLGYSISWGGAFIGLAYGFLDGLIGIAIIAWIYNSLCRRD